jgi:hypothetical protein
LSTRFGYQTFCFSITKSLEKCVSKSVVRHGCADCSVSAFVGQQDAKQAFEASKSKMQSHHPSGSLSPVTKTQKTLFFSVILKLNDGLVSEVRRWSEDCRANLSR